jgi:HK97 family phage major capsid protein
MSTVPRFSDRNRRHQVSDLASVICALADGRPLEEVAAPAILAATSDGNERRGFSGPWDAAASVPLGMALARDLTATGGASSGGDLIGSDRMDLQTTLRPFSAVIDAGVRAVSVPQGSGNVGVPSVTSAPVAQWMATENAAAPESDAVFGLASPLPKRLSFSFFVSWRLLKMGGAMLQAALDREVFNAVGRALDAAVLAGTGASGQPQGIVGSAGINTASGASLAHAALLEMRREALQGGAREDALRWIGTPAVQELLGARERTSGSGRFLWDDGAVLGRPAMATTAAPSATLIAGDFSRCTLYLFSDLDVIVDRRPLSGGGKVKVVVHLFADVSLGHPAAFSVASSVS